MAMTNKEYLIKALDGLNIDSGAIDIILLKGGLDGDASVDFKACDKAVYERFSVVLKGAATNVSEGGYSLSRNLEAVKMYYYSLCEELGLPNKLVSRPKIRNKSHIW